MSQLISLIYASAAIDMFSPEELAELLEISRANNKRDDITGMLLYKDGNFIQALEGPEEAVTRLYQKIQQDSRHATILLLDKRPIEKRQFPDWAMGFGNIGKLTSEQLEGFSTFIQDDLTPDYFENNPSRASVLLTSFKRFM